MLNERSKQVRRDTIALSKANGGYHYGGTFSCTEILISLYDHVLDLECDRFILSKGHGCWAYYVLLREKGYTPPLEGHPHRDVHNGVHWTTGSEGHGFPAGIGMALAKKMKKEPGHVYVIVGDGECQEGTTWESMLTTVKHGLTNLTVVVDNNGIQGSGYTQDILPIGALQTCAESIGWHVERVDGHLIPDVTSCLRMRHTHKPIMIIADTVKGKGVSYMEDKPCWHAQWPDPDHEERALEELK